MTKDTAPLGLTETLRRTPAGEVIYLTAASPTISACAASAGIKVTTARLLAIHPGTKAVTDITEVTVVSHPAQDSEEEFVQATRTTALRRVRERAHAV